MSVHGRLKPTRQKSSVAVPTRAITVYRQRRFASPTNQPATHTTQTCGLVYSAFFTTMCARKKQNFRQNFQLHSRLRCAPWLNSVIDAYMACAENQ